MPVDEFQTCFASSIDDAVVEDPVVLSTVPFAFDRVASQRFVCRLLRIGDPFIDALESFTRRDDRGRSYAFWRHVPSYRGEEDPAVFFKFDYVVSPAHEPLRQLCKRFSSASQNAILRRTRLIMKPLFTPVWLDSDFERVFGRDDDRVQWVAPHFSKQVGAGYQDFNLNAARWAVVSERYDMSLWRDRCFAARETSEEILREQSRLPKWSDDCVADATRQSMKIQQQYCSRLAIANGETRTSLEQDLIFEKELLKAQVQAFTLPDLRVDSVGAVFLSREMPFVENREWSDDD